MSMVCRSKFPRNLSSRFGPHDTVDDALAQLLGLEGLNDFDREMIHDAQSGLGAHVNLHEEVSGSS